MVFRTIRTRIMPALLALSMMAGGSAALAQGAGTPPAKPAAIKPMTDAEATKFVAANKKVTEVGNKMAIELQAAKSEEAAKAILTKAEKDMEAAIQTEGITPVRYTEIIQLAESDEKTLAKLRAKAGS